MTTRNGMQWALLGLLMVGLVSCARFHHPHSQKAIEQSAPVEAKASAADYEAQLKDLVAKKVAAENAAAGDHKTRIVYEQPYYFRQYSVYPEDNSEIKVVLQETESRSAPFVADVSVPKQRYVTRFHRERAEAEKDGNFIRGTGSEMMTYELRNSRWTRVGTIFVADRTEENVGGEWVPVKEVVKATVNAEDEKNDGWFKKIWSTLTGK